MKGLQVCKGHPYNLYTLTTIWYHLIVFTQDIEGISLHITLIEFMQYQS